MNNQNNDDGKAGGSLELRSDVGGVGGPGESKGWWKPEWTKPAVSGLVVFLVVFGGLALWSQLGQNSTNEDGDSSENGGVFGSLPDADDVFRGPVTESGYSGRTCDEAERRAIAVMLAGDPINRPISGFSKADQVWELPVLVSNVTRLMGVYQCGQPTEIGSVRSVRHDYLFLAEGLDAIMAHWGGSYHALNRIDVGEFSTLNALSNPNGAFFRKQTLPPPYNGFTTYENLWGALQALKYREKSEFEGYDFKDDAPTDERPAGGTLSIGWPGAFRVSFEYNPETNRYERYWAGVKQIDAEDGQVVAPSTVVVARASNGSQPGPGGYNDVGIEGSGELSVYRDGIEIKGRWEKSEIHKGDPMLFLDEAGDPIELTRGQVWIVTPEPSIAVTWEPVGETEAAGDGEA